MKKTYWDIVKFNRPELIKLITVDVEYFKKNPPLSAKPDDRAGPNLDTYRNYHLLEYFNTKYGHLKHRISKEEFESLYHQVVNSEDYQNYIEPIIDEYFSLVNFAYSGKKVFFFSNNLCEHLLNTQLNVSSELLRLPFETTLFVFSSKTIIQEYKKLLNKDFIPENIPISVIITEKKSAYGKRELLFSIWQADENYNYAYVVRTLLIKDGYKLENTLKTNWKDHTNIQIESNFDKRLQTEGLDFFRIILNGILYLSSNKPDIIEKISPHTELYERYKSLKSGRKKSKILKKMNQFSELNYNLVGSKIGEILIQKPTNNKYSNDRHPTYKLKYKFLVRGHWRNQPFGEKNKERKLIFINPYYKGPDFASEINKQYSVR